MAAEKLIYVLRLRGQLLKIRRIREVSLWEDDSPFLKQRLMIRNIRH